MSAHALRGTSSVLENGASGFFPQYLGRELAVHYMQALQLTEPLLVTHRLDMCTQGLVVLGKTTAFVQHFNKLLQQQGAVRKFYKTLTQSVPPLGLGSTASCVYLYASVTRLAALMHDVRSAEQM